MIVLMGITQHHDQIAQLMHSEVILLLFHAAPTSSNNLAEAQQAERDHELCHRVGKARVYCSAAIDSLFGGTQLGCNLGPLEGSRACQGQPR